jgi:hypothetical protein
MLPFTVYEWNLKKLTEVGHVTNVSGGKNKIRKIIFTNILGHVDELDETSVVIKTMLYESRLTFIGGVKEVRDAPDRWLVPLKKLFDIKDIVVPLRGTSSLKRKAQSAAHGVEQQDMQDVENAARVIIAISSLATNVHLMEKDPVILDSKRSTLQFHCMTVSRGRLCEVHRTRRVLQKGRVDVHWMSRQDSGTLATIHSDDLRPFL